MCANAKFHRIQRELGNGVNRSASRYLGACSLYSGVGIKKQMESDQGKAE